MPTNWPPATAPSWPPPELNDVWFSCSDMRELMRALLEFGFTRETPTSDEQTAFFQGVLCDYGHNCAGFIMQSPSLVRYPFALCPVASHMDFLVPWPPYYCGYGSNNYTG